MNTGEENKCLGLFGYIFGHSFKKFLVKEKFNQSPNISFDIEGNENALNFIESQRNIYIIKCKRCGKEVCGE